VILIGTAVHIPFTAVIAPARRAGQPAPEGATRPSRLALPGSPAPPAAEPEGPEKYPVAPNYPAEHLFTTNTYML